MNNVSFRRHDEIQEEWKECPWIVLIDKMVICFILTYIYKIK